MKMKKLFESWRVHLTEELDHNVDEDVVAIAKKLNWHVNRYLGGGKFGRVYEMEDDSGKRFAAKFIPDANIGVQQNEYKVYNFVKDHKERLET